MQRVGILVHPTRPVESALDEIRAWVNDRGLELVQIPIGEQPSVAPAGEVSACDLVMAVGGDGTVLKALHAAAATGTPVLGVARGSLGALTTLAETEIRDGLDRFFAGEWSARRLPALILSSDQYLGAGLNDIVLIRRGGTQLAVDLRVAGELYARIAGDGIVIATALGSSAYSMAAGGPLVMAGSEGFVCTPLAMHGGHAPPLVVPHDAAVDLAVHPGHGGFALDIDGFGVDTEAVNFHLAVQNVYATLVDLGGPASGLTGLRERWLIIDSPRVTARDRRTQADR
jgi:NAD+ kinase